MMAATTYPLCQPFAQSTITAVNVYLPQDAAGATVLKLARLETLKALC